MRNLVIARLQELAAITGETVLIDSYGEEHDIAKLDQKSNADLLALLEDLIGFSG